MGQADHQLELIVYRKGGCAPLHIVGFISMRALSSLAGYRLALAAGAIILLAPSLTVAQPHADLSGAIRENIPAFDVQSESLWGAFEPPPQTVNASRQIAPCSTSKTKTFELEGEATDYGLIGSTEDDRGGGQSPRAFAWAGEQIERTIKLSMTRALPNDQLFVVKGGIYDSRATVTQSFERLFAPFDQSSRDITANYIEFGMKFFGNRFEMKSQFAHAHGYQFPFASAGGDINKSMFRTGSARSHHISVKLIDTPAIGVSVEGIISSVDRAYYAPTGARPAGILPLPANRTYFGARLKVLSIGFYGSSQSINSPFFSRDNKTATLSYDSSEVSFFTKSTSRYSLIIPSKALSRSPVNGATVEFAPSEIAFKLTDAVPSLIVSLMPSLVSVTASRGTIQRPATAPLSPPQRTTNIDTLAVWDTRFGETTLSYWREAVASRPLDPRPVNTLDELVDVSHSFRQGDWRLSVGLSLMRSLWQDDSFHSRDDNLSGQLSFSYQPVKGPMLEARLGTEKSQSLLDDELLASGKTTDLHITVDLSSYFAKVFMLPQGSLKAEYRRRFDRGDEQLSFDLGRCCNEALLVSFSARL